jgi:eukaryotic-like serine/threonine-protein kinase
MSHPLPPRDPDVLPSLQAALGDGFVIERELGGGGMSRVFVATETALARRVAIKVLLPELFQGVSAERFAREIALAAQLQDPHIVPVLTTGATADGLPWYTMPFVEGESLRARMARGAVPIEETVRILRDVAEALEYAHGRGIVHRDIKPENVLLSGRNAVVADFGIAKAMSAARGSMPTGTITSVGLSLGTPAYMSPEQVGGDAVDHRSDLYAWGMMAYELLAGAHPFANRTQAAQLMAAQLSEVPRALDDVRPGLPPSLGALVMQCLAKSADERPESATALLATLAGTTSGQASGARTTMGTRTAPRSRRAVMLAAVGLLVVFGAGGVVMARRGGASAGALSAVSATPSVAVLPFEHQGDSADVYLTEGITDEIRGKLSGVRDLVVIARASSNSYRNSNKTPQQIAEELGVRYLLTGTARVVGSGENRRVIVRPELVEITANGQPQSRWGQPFDVGGDDVLGLQGQVASQVVAAMEVPLAGVDERQRLQVVATRDPVAYDLLLRARAATQFNADLTPRAFIAAIALLEEAVARDSNYADAWMGLAVMRSNLFLSTPSPELAEAARQAAERAKRLDPTGAAGAKAMGAYLARVALDAKGAAVENERAFRADPSDMAAAANLGGSLLSQGRIEEALQHYEDIRRRDPRQPAALGLYIGVLQRAGRFAEARAAAGRLQALAPQSLNTVVSLFSIELSAGDPVAARRIVQESLQRFPPDQLLPELFERGHGWLVEFDVAQPFLRRAPEPSSGYTRELWFLWRADDAWLRGDTTEFRRWGDSAVRVFSKQRTALPNDATIAMNLSQAYAYAGQSTRALAESKAGLALVLKAGFERSSPRYSSTLPLAASVAMIVNDQEAALDWLEEASSLPLKASGGYLRIFPYFAALRGNPRFERITGAGPP